MNLSAKPIFNFAHLPFSSYVILKQTKGFSLSRNFGSQELAKAETRILAFLTGSLKL